MIGRTFALGPRRLRRAPWGSLFLLVVKKLLHFRWIVLSQPKWALVGVSSVSSIAVNASLDVAEAAPSCASFRLAGVFMSSCWVQFCANCTVSRSGSAGVGSVPPFLTHSTLSCGRFINPLTTSSHFCAKADQSPKQFFGFRAFVIV